MTTNTTGAPRSDADELMFGGGAKSASFLTIGQTYSGPIVSEPTKVQATEYNPGGGAGKPKVWDNGDPVWQLRVIIQTDLRESEDDDGRRAIYLDGSRKPESRSKLAAAIAAVKAAGRQLEVGGVFAIQFTDTTPSAGGGSDTKHYRAHYTPPATDAQAMLTPETPQAPAQAPVPTPAPATAWPTTPAPQAAPQDPWATAPSPTFAQPATTGAGQPLPGQQALPVVASQAEVGLRDKDEAVRLAGILKVNGVPAETILRTYPQLTAAEVEALPPF